MDRGLLRSPTSRPRVLLFNPPAPRPVLRDNYCGFMSKASYLWPPIDLLVQSGWLHGSCSVSVLDAVAEGLSLQRTLERATQSGPHLVFMLSSGATFQDDAGLAEGLRRRLPDVTVVVGISPLVIPARTYLERYPWADAVLTDYTSADLLDALQGRTGGGWLVTRDSAAAGEGAPDVPPPLQYPVPRHELFPLQRYSLPLGWRGRFSTVLTGFGCAHDCSFCTGSAIRHRRRRAQDVLDELEAMRAQKIENLFFVDYTFTSSRRFVLDLCRQMVARGFSFRWTCFGRVDQVNDDEVIAAMKAAGCDLIQLGVESGDDGILQRYRKGFSVAQAREAFARCRRQGVRTLAFFIIGLPGETRATVQQTIELALELDPDLASFSVPTPDPGTSLLNQAVQQGILAQGPAQVVSTVGPTVASAQLPAHEIAALQAEAVRRFYLRPAFLVRQAQGLRSLSDLREKARNAASLLLRRR